MIKIAISGAAGRIGRTIYKSLIGSTEFEPVFGVDVGGADDLPYPVYKSFAASPLDADVVIDFSSPAALDDILAYAAEKKCRLVLATTGYTPEQEKRVEYAANEVPVFRASNMSLGVNLLGNLAKEAAKFLGEDYDIEIVETHHNRKLDSPSGTALTLANEINSVRDNSLVYTYGRHEVKHRREANEIGIHAVRGGTVVGKHEIMFLGTGDGKHEIMFLGTGEVITLMHESENKEVFVRGALRAAKFLMDKQSGLYDMTSIIAQNYAVTSVSTEKDVALVTLPRISFDGFLTRHHQAQRHQPGHDQPPLQRGRDGRGLLHSRGRRRQKGGGAHPRRHPVLDGARRGEDHHGRRRHAAQERRCGGRAFRPARCRRGGARHHDIGDADLLLHRRTVPPRRRSRRQEVLRHQMTKAQL